MENSKMNDLHCPLIANHKKDMSLAGEFQGIGKQVDQDLAKDRFVLIDLHLQILFQMDE